MQATSKRDVQEFWDAASCGEELYLHGFDVSDYAAQAEARYKLEPYILEFASFPQITGKSILEVGVGLGADHERLAMAGGRMTGIDLTPRAISHTKRRFELRSLSSHLQVADAENLPFEDNSFDGVYSWGVIHHSPNTPVAAAEILRVLKPGGLAKIMIYHKYSFVGYMLWVRYALLKLKPFTTLESIYSQHLESPGTKAYSVKQARKLFGNFEILDIHTVLTHGDLLSSDAGQRHRGLLLSLAKRVWPRRVIQMLFPGHGLFMLITVKKPEKS